MSKVFIFILYPCDFFMLLSFFFMLLYVIFFLSVRQQNLIIQYYIYLEGYQEYLRGLFCPVIMMHVNFYIKSEVSSNMPIK